MKSGLLVTFLLRLTVSAAAVWRILCLQAQFQLPALLNVTFASVPTTIATELEVCLAVLTCNVLFVKGFIGMMGKARDFEVDNMAAHGEDESTGTPPMRGLRHMLSARFGFRRSDDTDPEMIDWPEERFAHLEPRPAPPLFECQFSEAHSEPTPSLASPKKYKVPFQRQAKGSVDEHADSSFRVTRDVSVSYEHRSSQSGRASINLEHLGIDLDEAPSVPHRPSFEYARQWLARGTKGRPPTPQPDLDMVEEKE